MTKEVLIALIQKDIRELEVLTKGFSETEIPSETMLHLASAKAQEVVVNLQDLAEFKAKIPETVVETIEILVSTEEPAPQVEVIKETPQEPIVAPIEPEEIIPIAVAPIEKKTDFFSKLKEDSIINSLANKKINDIKQAINIANRFRFQRELFGNSAEKMNETLAFLNACSGMEEANNYLSTNFDWNEDNESTQEFLNLVHRLFV